MKPGCASEFGEGGDRDRGKEADHACAADEETDRNDRNHHKPTTIRIPRVPYILPELESNNGNRCAAYDKESCRKKTEEPKDFIGKRG
jgi:hypothetical protein